MAFSISSSVVTSIIYNLVRIDLQEQHVRQAFYTALDQETMLLAEFRPYRGDLEPPFYFDQMVGPLTDLGKFERPGPTIKIYQLSP